MTGMFYIYTISSILLPIVCFLDRRNRLGLFRPTLLISLATASLAWAAPQSNATHLSIVEVSQQMRAPVPDGLSGITFVASNRFYAVDDSGGQLFPMKIEIDRATGALISNTNAPGLALQGRDLEGVAYDGLHKSVLVSDESDSSIKAYRLDGKLLTDVDVPLNLKACRLNFSLESLAMHPDGSELWTANEEACFNPTLGVDDGPLSSTNAGSVVRLTRFTRDTPQSSWQANGQWAYRTDPIGGRVQGIGERSGVVDLALLPDGTLLVLEREISTKRFFPEFRARIYQVNFTEATPVSTIKSLNGARYQAVSKRRLFEKNTMLANYEGLCLGPALTDGNYALVLISDGDNMAVEFLYSLKLLGLVTNGADTVRKR